MNYQLNPNLLSNDVERKSARQGFGDEITELAKGNKRIVVLDADLGESLRLEEYKKKFPSRFIQMGVAEANMISVAAGLALEGFIPFTSSFACFTPYQAVSQIRISVAYNKANVKIIGGHAGIVTGGDGASHQALEDIAIMRSIPNITVFSPCDYWQMRKCVKVAAKISGPVYIRFSRRDVPMITTGKTPFRINECQVLRDGTDGTILAHGESVYRALLAAETLYKEKKLDFAVLNVHTIKPLDEKTILKYAKRTRAFVVVEDHQIAGGLCGAVSEYLAENYPIPVQFVGIRDKFGESGDPEKLLKKFHIDVEDIIEAGMKIRERKRMFVYNK
ncbi:MAG TPA: transketolase C-terminal domain-containing protein [Patescibacteria group bacterium]|nr:transketolase C-terminal domain-containing protein [Patescibacteria group bacterium]